MKKSLTFVLLTVFCSHHSAYAQQDALSRHEKAIEIITLEKAALERWIRIDPAGYLDLYAPEITYFDPGQEKRVDGYEAMDELLAPMKQVQSPIKNPRFDMIDPQVQFHGDIGVLTFNLINYGIRPDAREESELRRWNATEVYARMDGHWKIIHTHWSITKPQ